MPTRDLSRPASPIKPPDRALGGRTRWLVGALLVLATVLRLSHLDLISITNDEGSHGLIAMFVVGADVENWPLAGLPSVGVRNSAFFIYLLALANWVYWHPLTGAYLVAGLNIAALILLYRLTRAHFGTAAALVASSLYATSPWAVLYARNMWPPSCLAVVCLVLIGMSLRWLDHGGKARLAGMAFLGFVIPQVHFSGFCAPLWLLVVLIVGRKRIAWGALTAGAVVGLATWTPWIIFQQITEWNDIRSAAGVAEGKQSAGGAFLQSLNYVQALLHSGEFRFWFGHDPAEFPELFPLGLRIAAGIAAAVLVAAFVAAGVWAVSRPADRTLRLLVLWCFVPVMALTLVRPAVYPHYVVVAYPIPFLLIGALAGRFLDRVVKWRTAGVGVAVAGIAVVHLAFLAGWFRYVEAGRTTGEGHFELSYRQRRATALSALGDSTGRQIELAGPLAGTCAAYDYIYSYEQADQGFFAFPIDPSRRYWIDEDHPPDGADEAEWRREKTAFINRILAEYQSTPPQWRIEKHWAVGPSRVYRIHLNAPMP